MDIAIIRQLAAVPLPHQKWKFKSVKDANAEILRLENLLGVEHGPAFFNIVEANLRVLLLERLIAAKVATPPAAPAPIAVPPADAAAQSQSLAVVSGRARFNASCTRDAAAKPKAKKSHPELHGRDRFSADARINATPQIISGNPIPAGLKGRARFAAAVKADFAKKQ
jgi:hypothetical protein